MSKTPAHAALWEHEGSQRKPKRHPQFAKKEKNFNKFPYSIQFQRGRENLFFMDTEK